jgi:ABC-2 type transport system ATP-binding protein
MLTVMENLRHHGRLYGLRGEDLTRRCRRALEALEVADRARDRAAALSGGLRRRVEIAKVLTHSPRLLLLDEPSAGLDPRARAGLLAILHDLRQRLGTTVLMTTHFTEEADRCDRVAIMDAGKVVVHDAPGALKQRVDGAAVAQRLMTHPTLEDVYTALTGRPFDAESAWPS